jgi:Ca2+/Na+ antiporter
MKVSHILMVLIVFAWPLNYLYQRQLGAISFLLLAIFFLVVSIKEMKKVKQAKKNDSEEAHPQKFK